MSRVFLIAGLGADSRLYKNIVLPCHELVYVEWFDPEYSDTLTNYAQKITDQYNIKNGDVVIGDSLGGMLTVEIAKKLRLSKAVIISSIKTSIEAPAYFTFFRWIPVYKILPDFLFNSLGFTIKMTFGAMPDEDLKLFKSMLKNSSPKFMRWAMHAVLHWKNEVIPENLHHITGNNDKVFNYKRIKGATIIDGGTHIMIFDRANEISILLQEIIH